MLGAIAGDIIGSVYEWENIKSEEFPLFSDNSDFTDDTVLTIAVADSLLNELPYTDTYKYWSRLYPTRGYGAQFYNWAISNETRPYNSWGNGSAMRVSPIGFAFYDMEKVVYEAKKSAEVTHNHPEGIMGAQVVAASVFLARQGESKRDIKKYLTENFDYNLDIAINEIRKTYKYDPSCRGSIPVALAAFFESSDFESAIRKAVSVGGDSDTIASIAGSIAHAFYDIIPDDILDNIELRLPYELLNIVYRFCEEFNI